MSEPGRGYIVVPESLNGTASQLVELAALLWANRPNLDAIVLTAEPNAHKDVDAEARKLSEYAYDQYQDAVALLCALSIRLDTAAKGYTRVDDEAARNVASVLTDTRYESRTKVQ
jgi:hypothetical protein